MDKLEYKVNDTGVKWDILGLAEVRREGARLITLKSQRILYHTDASNGQQGVGFLINRNLKDNILEVKQINTRLYTLKTRINKKYTREIIQVYMPTTSSTDEEMWDMYEDIAEQLITDSHYKILMGDFNVKIGLKEDQEE